MMSRTVLAFGAVAALSLTSVVRSEGGDDPFVAAVIGVLPFQDTGDTTDNTDAFDAVCPFSGSTSPDVWYAYAAPLADDAHISISLCESGYDTKVYVLDDQFNLVGCNDDGCEDALGNEFRSCVTVALVAGQSYYIAVDGWGGESGLYTISVMSHMDLPGLEFDADEDGLLDCWERNGLDHNGDGIIDLDLPAMGAKPDHKDLFVEVDVMPGVHASQAAIDLVVGPFSRAPIDNPDGVDGIALHVDWATRDIIPFEEEWDFDDFDASKAIRIGTTAERADANWLEIKAARKLAFRHCIFVNSLVGGAIGRAEVLGNDFMVAVGEIPDPAVRLVSWTFMHELGHNLGLRHGGANDRNYKPNYVSAMNYGFIYFDEWTGRSYTEPDLDYSRELSDLIFPPLNEGGLDETVGTRSAAYPNVFTFFGYDDGGVRSVKRVKLRFGAVDWNQDLGFDDSVVADINWVGLPGGSVASPGEELRSFNDWALVQLPIGFGGEFADGVHATVDSPEITGEIIQWLEENVLEPPLGCLGDFDGNNQLDFNDLVPLLATWGPCLDCPQDLDFSAAVDFPDLVILLSTWGPCP